MFIIKSIRIYEDCKYRKILKPDTYSFGDTNVKDFYGDGVSVHVIVGKNGSGKSSLLDILLRMVNNLAVLILRGQNRLAADYLKYVLHIYADIEYIIDGKQCKLSCRDRAMWLETPDCVYWLSDESILGHPQSRDKHLREQLKTHRVNSVALKPSKDLLQEIADSFFYTVATNYSMLGFLAPDYNNEECCYYKISAKQKSPNTNKSGTLFDANGREQHIVSVDKTFGWISSIFHKNDGYMCPVVLNPYRNHAHIDMGNETYLTQQRIAALWICENPEMPFMDDYELDKVVYTLKTDLYNKYKDVQDVSTMQGLLQRFQSIAQFQYSYAYIILTELGCAVTGVKSRALVQTALYIVYKALSIASKYPSYTGLYEDIGSIHNAFEVVTDDVDILLLYSLAHKLKRNHSHIEQKLHQAIGFFRWGVTHESEISKLRSEFTYRKYAELRKLGDMNYGTLLECMDTMPPAIFAQSIYLHGKSSKGRHKQPIPLTGLSAGERQFIYQMSTIAYHLHNLKSVSKDNMHYKNVNILLDEVEICYHPDYQRTFLKKMLDMLRIQGLSEYFGIHVLLTTHSPFVLSDIPKSQIIYLKKGHQLDEEERTTLVNPFAANVNDILAQSFFLEGGFMGAVAQKKLMEVIGCLSKGISNMQSVDLYELERLIDEIGDPFVRGELKTMVSEYVRTHTGNLSEDYKAKRREQIRKELELLS